MGQVERRFLRALRDAGLEGLARSAVRRSCRPLVQELLTCQAIRWCQAGRGGVFQVVNEAAFEATCCRHFPLGLEEPVDPVVDRASAVLLLGDAKAVNRARCEGVFVRSTKPGSIVREVGSGAAIPVTDLTAAAGGAALLLDDERQWSFKGTVAVIENAEAFWRHDRVLNVDLAIYAAGRMSSRRVLNWLASPAMEECSFIHWGDYDPVGAYEYHRLATACPGRVTMHTPNDLEGLLARHGKRELLEDQVDVLHQVRRRGNDPLIARLIELWDRHGRGLEQELLLNLPCTPDSVFLSNSPLASEPSTSLSNPLPHGDRHG